MRALNETDKYIKSLDSQEDTKQAEQTEDILGQVLNAFSTFTSTVKDLESVMVALQSSTPEPETEEPQTENEEE